MPFLPPNQQRHSTEDHAELLEGAVVYNDSQLTVLLKLFTQNK